MVQTIEKELQEYAAIRKSRVEAFAKVYPDLIKEAQPKLRVLFNENDYRRDAISAFSMGWQFLMFTSPTELEGISTEMFEVERQKMMVRMNEAYEEARMVLRQAMADLVNHLRESLEPDLHGAPRRLSASTLGHLQEFLNNFNLRNVTNDSELQRYVDNAKKVLNGVEIEALRTTDGLRQNIRASLDSIERSITQTLEVVPKRRIKVS